ncbi:unnamed protein product [Closterium sp. Yama58-4]|nr:unnamed protein product [Closterium sp. Yama58-4]
MFRTPWMLPHRSRCLFLYSHSQVATAGCLRSTIKRRRKGHTEGSNSVREIYSSMATARAHQQECRLNMTAAANRAVNNFKSWNLPPCCVPHVARYVSSGAYYADHSAAIAAAAAFFKVPLVDGLSHEVGAWERWGRGGEGAVGVQVGSVLGRKGGEGKGAGAAGRGDSEGDWVWGEGQPPYRGVSGRLNWETSRQQAQEGGNGNGETRGGEGREEVGRGQQQKRQEVVVFDIDETLLSNLPYLEAHGYGSEPYDSSKWADWVFTSSAPPLPAGIALVRALQTTASIHDNNGPGKERYAEESYAEEDSREGGVGAGGLGVALVTGRPESQRAATVENLRRVGVTQWKVLMMRPLDANGSVVQETAVQFKSRCRREIEAMGMHIVAQAASMSPEPASCSTEPDRPPILHFSRSTWSQLSRSQLIYLLVVQGVGSAILDAGANFGIATAMYRGSPDPVRVWELPNSLAGDAIVTIMIQGTLTWVIAGLLTRLDVKSERIQPIFYQHAPRPLQDFNADGSSSSPSTDRDDSSSSRSASPSAALATHGSASETLELRVAFNRLLRLREQLHDSRLKRGSQLIERDANFAIPIKDDDLRHRVMEVEDKVEKDLKQQDRAGARWRDGTGGFEGGGRLEKEALVDGRGPQAAARVREMRIGETGGRRHGGWSMAGKLQEARHGGDRLTEGTDTSSPRGERRGFGNLIGWFMGVEDERVVIGW